MSTPPEPGALVWPAPPLATPAEDANALLVAARRGDPTARAALFDRHRDYAFAVARRLAADDDAAADLVQDGFLKAFSRLHQYRGEAPFEAWLARIIVRAGLDQRRRAARLRPLEELAEAASPAVDPDDRLDRARLRSRLAQAVARLDPRMRLALLMHYRDDRSYPEISARLGIPAGTVASRLSRARRHLARLLGRGE